MTTEITHRFEAHHRDRLDRLIAEALPSLSRSQAQRLIEQGQVVVAGHSVTRPAHAVEQGIECRARLHRIGELLTW